MQKIEGKKIAIITENGFEESELMSPKTTLEEAGVTVQIVSLKGKVKGWKDGNWSIELPVDVNLADAKVEDYDALVIPVVLSIQT